MTMEDVTPRPSETQTSANSHLSPAHALHMGSDHVSQARRIRRREKLALKRYGSFIMDGTNFILTAQPTQAEMAVD